MRGDKQTRGLMVALLFLSGCATAGTDPFNRCMVWDSSALGGAGAYVPGQCPRVDVGDRLCPTPEKDPSNSLAVMQPNFTASMKQTQGATSLHPPQLGHVDPVPERYSEAGDQSGNRWENGKPIGAYFSRMSCMELAEIVQTIAILQRQDPKAAGTSGVGIGDSSPEHMLVNAFLKALQVKGPVTWGISPEEQAISWATDMIYGTLTPEQIRQYVYRDVCLGEVDMNYANEAEARSQDIVNLRDKTEHRSRIRELLVKMHSPRNGYYSRLQN